MVLVDAALRLYLATLWVLAGLGKLADSPERPLLGLRALNRPGLLRKGARLFSIVEVGLGVGLVSGTLFPFIPLASAGLFLGFAGLRILLKLRGNCGCFGALGREKPLHPMQLLAWAAPSLWLAFDYGSAAAWRVGFLATMVVGSIGVVGVTAYRPLSRQHRRRPRQANA